MKQFAESVSDGLYSLVTWAIVSLASAGVWIVRRIFTNQKELEMLRFHLEEREKHQEADRARILEDVDELKSDVKEINKNILSLFQVRK